MARAKRKARGNTGAGGYGAHGTQFLPLWGGQANSPGGGGNQPVQPYILEVQLDDIIRSRGVNPFAMAGIHCVSPTVGVETLIYTPAMPNAFTNRQQTRAQRGSQPKAGTPQGAKWLAQQVQTLAQNQKQTMKTLSRLTNQMQTISVGTGKQRKGQRQAQPFTGAAGTPPLVRV